MGSVAEECESTVPFGDCFSPIRPDVCPCKDTCKYPSTGIAVAAPMGDGLKPSNPKDVVGIRKVGWHVIPFPVLWELANAMTEGAYKYGAHNYREAGVRASVYIDATMGRHLAAWWEGEDIDPDSGESHITKAIASLVVLRDSMLKGNWVDDRPIKSDPNLLRQANERAAALCDKYPNPVAPFTQVRFDKERKAA